MWILWSHQIILCVLNKYKIYIFKKCWNIICLIILYPLINTFNDTREFFVFILVILCETGTIQPYIIKFDRSIYYTRLNFFTFILRANRTGSFFNNFLLLFWPRWTNWNALFVKMICWMALKWTQHFVDIYSTESVYVAHFMYRNQITSKWILYVLLVQLLLKKSVMNLTSFDNK